MDPNPQLNVANLLYLISTATETVPTRPIVSAYAVNHKTDPWTLHSTSSSSIVELQPSYTHGALCGAISREIVRVIATESASHQLLLQLGMSVQRTICVIAPDNDVLTAVRHARLQGCDVEVWHITDHLPWPTALRTLDVPTPGATMPLGKILSFSLIPFSFFLSESHDSPKRGGVDPSNKRVDGDRRLRDATAASAREQEHATVVDAQTADDGAVSNVDGPSAEASKFARIRENVLRTWPTTSDMPPMAHTRGRLRLWTTAAGSTDIHGNSGSSSGAGMLTAKMDNRSPLKRRRTESTDEEAIQNVSKV